MIHPLAEVLDDIASIPTLISVDQREKRRRLSDDGTSSRRLRHASFGLSLNVGIWQSSPMITRLAQECPADYAAGGMLYRITNTQ